MERSGAFLNYKNTQGHTSLIIYCQTRHERVCECMEEIANLLTVP